MTRTTYKPERIERALLRKGFVLRHSDHRQLVLMVEGRISRVRTKISHGRKEYSGALLNAVRRQLGRLTTREFDDLVECPMSLQAYITLLEERGAL